MPPRVLAGFAAAVGAIVVAVGIFFAVVSARDERAARVVDTSETLLALERLEGLLWQAESGQRGYLLTHDARYLEPYERAVSEIRAAVERIEARLAGPGHRGHVARLSALVEARLAEMRRGIAARDERGLDEALRGLEGDEGVRLTEKIAALAEEIAAAQGTALGRRRQAWFGSIALADAAFLGAHLLLLALVVLAGLAVRNEMRTREAHQREREGMLALQERLLAVVGHDLRNPLSAIEAGVTLLSRAELAAPQARTAARVLSSSRRMARMVRDLLDWTRVRTGAGIPVSRRHADLGEICRSMLDEIALRPGGPLVELEAEGDLCGRWDPDRLEQAFGNLVSNGLRYAPEGRPIRIRAVGEPSRVRLEFENDGPPIPPEVMRSMFDPFRRGASPSETGGLGLGLFIVRSIIEAHGGTVEVTSAPSRPVRFTVVLPKERGEERQPGSWSAPRPDEPAAPEPSPH
jgi:signal transduction histidine kinase